MLTGNGATLGTAIVQSNGTFSANVTLPNQGANSIVATVTDSYGNTGHSAAVVDLFDNIPPTVTITSAAEASRNATQTIAGTVVSGGTAAVVGQTVILTDNGTTIGTATVQSNGSFTANVTLPSQGANSIVATLTDSYGNTGSSAAVVDTLDNIPPTVTITSAAEASQTAVTQTITGTVVSGGAATVVGRTVTLTDNGATLATATVQSNGTFAVTVTPPLLGANAIVATVSDSYGNTGSSAAVVDTIGSVAPTITGTRAGQTTTSQAPIDPFSGVTIGDINIGATDTLTITLSGAGGTLSGTGLSGSNGTYTLSGTASTITSELDALVFTPVTGHADSSQTTSFKLSDVSTAFSAPQWGNLATTLASLNGTNGSFINGGLILDSSGNLLGTAEGGGPGGDGTVFELTKSGSGFSSTPTLLATFSGTDGASPDGSLITDAAGDLFGATGSGGANNDGTIFEITMTTNGNYSGQTVLASFSGSNGNGPTGVSIDAAGDLFGTTLTGGADNKGTVFEITKNGSGYSSTPTVLVSFNGTDGAFPFASVIMDSAGDLFGTTDGGGANGDGTVFEIAKTATGYSSTPTELVSFNGTDGASLQTHLVMDAAGDLFGTAGGGANGLGEVFEIVKTGSGYSSTPTVIYNSVSGAVVDSNLTLDAAGDIYGTTALGGPNNTSGVFEIAKTANGYGPMTGVQAFNSSNIPDYGLFMDASGDLFGQTGQGGANGDGSVFEIKPTALTPVATVDSTTTVTNVDPAVPPTVTVTSAAEASNVAAQTITGTVTSVDATVAGQTVTLTDNGTILATTTVGTNGAFTASVTLSNEGANSIVATVTDSLGLTGSSSAVVDTLDNIAPTVTITSAAEASRNASQTITGTVASGGTAAVVGQTVTLTDNGTTLGTATVQANGAFSASVTLPNEDANSIVATVTDSYGNTGSSAAVVDTLDNVVPTVTITSAAEASSVAAQTITGTVASGGTAAVAGQTVTLTDNGITLGTATVQANGTFAANVTLPNQGANSIVARVSDSYGNTGSSSVVVDTLDNIAPTVTITSAAETSDIAAQNITGTVISGGAAVVVGQTVTLTDNGVALGTTTVQADGTFSANVTLPNQGTNSIVARVTDSFGNAGSSATVVDTLAADNAVAVAITGETLADDTGASPTDFVTMDGQITLTGTTSAGATVAIFDGNTDLGNATVSGTNWTFSDNLGEGTHQLDAVATSPGGSTATSAPAQAIVVDDTPPRPVITNISSFIVGTDIDSAISGTSEANSSIQLFLGNAGAGGTTLLGTTTTDAAGNWSLDIGPLPDGEDPLTVVATDLAGNVGTYSPPPPDAVVFFAPTNNGTPVEGRGVLDLPWQQDGITTVYVNAPAPGAYLQANGYGDLTVQLFGDSADSLVLPDDLKDQSGVVTSGVEELAFSDGTVVNLGGAMTFTWLGNTTNYNLTGSNFGSNIFDITTGNGSIIFGNSSQGGSGTNTIEFDKGDGVADVNLNGGTGVVEFGSDISSQDVYWQADGYGNLYLRLYGDTSDSILVQDDLTHPSGSVVSGLDQLKFSDGTVVNLGGAMTFTWLGNANNYNLTGSNFGSNVFDITTGNGSISFGNSSQGGSGTNTIEFDKGDGVADVNLNGGTGVVEFGSDISSQDVYWQADGYGNLYLRLYGDTSDSILVQDDLTHQSGPVVSGLNQLQFSDGTVVNLGGAMTFTWLGNANNYNLTGSNFGSNVFDITTGNGSISFGNSSQGGSGTNTIEFDKGDGVADVNLNGGTGVVEFGSDISSQDVYWQGDGYGNLYLKLYGDSSDSILVQNDLTKQSGSVVSGLDQLEFSDGTVVNLGGAMTFTWLGNTNNYNLTGSNFGSNVFDITTGNGSIAFGNSSQGGSGTNTIEFDEGDGNASVSLNGGTGVIAFGSDISSQDVYWQADGYGNLYLRFYGDTSDSILVQDDLTKQSGSIVSGLDQLDFSDGTVVNLGGAMTFTWLGNTNNYNLTGSNFGSNVFDITTGNGSISFGSSSQGGSGTNTIEFEKGDGNASVSLNGGTGVIAFGAGVSAEDVYLQANGYGDLIVQIRNDATDSITIHNDLTDNAWGVSSGISELQFSDGSVLNLGQPAAGQGAPLSFTWIGTPNASISGSGFGANTFELGAGSESFAGGNTNNGGNGNNTYLASANTGQASISTNEAAGTTNELDFTGGITDENLWFINSGNNLKIDLLGTNTSVTVDGWFSSSSNQLQEITAGGLKIDSQISQLVQAMATYSANNSGFNPTSPSITAVPSDSGLQNSLAAAWHS
jgi:uncharacterized repeat protein (TIGR03803 family)